MHELTSEQQQILGLMTSRGIATSRDLQQVTGRSQATISRLLAGLPIVALGSGRAARYGLPKSIHGSAAQQPLTWTSEAGETASIGNLTLLATDIVHVESSFAGTTTSETLPWYLSTLRVEGFLGRLHARRLAEAGVAPDPRVWDVETQLYAAMQLQDLPGALMLGDFRPESPPSAALPETADLATRLDALAQDIARTLPAGSSAAGEQPKFLARLEDGRHVLVKFTPPLRTPFGDRWSELLRAECLAARVLAAHGVAVANSRIVESATRTYLLSERFDRIGARGRRHVVSVGAAHRGFVQDSYGGWSAACSALAQRGHLSATDSERATALHHFGRLIGNSDMHSGNLSLFVSLDGLAAGKFELAPVYDMLPMRWRPDPLLGGAPDFAAFEPDVVAVGGPARGPAEDFWRALSDEPGIGNRLRKVARDMADRLR